MFDPQLLEQAFKTVAEKQLQDKVREWFIHSPHEIQSIYAEYVRLDEQKRARDNEIDYWLIRKVPNTEDQYYVAEGNPPQDVKDMYNIKD